MNSKTFSAVKLEKLLRLQKLRITKAEEQYRTSQSEYQKINGAMLQREARIKKMRAEFELLTNLHSKQGVNELVRFSSFAHARKKWLEHDLERDEYWLKDDLQELRQAEMQVIEKRHLWLRTRVHKERLQLLLKDAKTSKSRHIENCLETEIAEFSALDIRSL